ncbi:MliC family protein [Vreelandella olivaria]|uniref:MliC family protein n=1 Tax=Vreelandella olivaria TaxID=390919 RepID=UPI00201EEAEA|nr:MliC family protein [Halomonas olivaria]
MRYSHLSLTAVLTSLLLAGCTTASTPSHDPQDNYPQADYRCDDGTELTVIFDQQEDTALVMVGGDTLRLESQRPASGMWYASPRHEFRGKGDEATWTVGRRVPTECRVI